MRVRVLIVAGVTVALAAAGTLTAASGRSAAGQVQADLSAARELLAGAANSSAGSLAARLALVERAGARVRAARSRLASMPPV